MHHATRGASLQAATEFLDLPVRFILRHAVAFLDPSGKIFAVSFGELQVLLGQLAPFRLQLAGELLPLDLDLVMTVLLV